MPKKNKNRKNKSNAIDLVHYPVIWMINAGQSAQTTVKSLHEQFDRRRPFRVASVSFEFSSEKAPSVIYAVAYSPESSVDSVWTSKPILIPTGTVRRGRWRIPVTTNSWFPSDVQDTFPLFQVYCNCPQKGFPSRVNGLGTFSIKMGPWEFNTSCPGMMQIQPCIAEQEDDSSEISIISGGQDNI